MKKLICVVFSLAMLVFAANAQKGIDFSHNYAAGGKLLMCIDSLAKNVSYWNLFPNQPNTSFNYLPDVNNVSIQIYFRKRDNIEKYRYTILIDNKPIAVNKGVNQEQLSDVDTGDEVFKTMRLGIFPLNGKIITTLLYSIQTPLKIEKSVFYGKPIPKAKIQLLSKFLLKNGYSSSSLVALRGDISITLNKDDTKLTLVKDKTDIDYLYSVSIKSWQTGKEIFKSTTWEYGHYVDQNEFLPYVKIDKSIFKTSGDYEVIIQPLIKGDTTKATIEKYTTKHTLSINLEEEKLFSEKQLISYSLIWSIIAGAIVGGASVLIMNKRKIKKVAEQAKQKEVAQLKLNSVRSQLNPHFLFNALAGIQNLMNKNEIDNANRYLSKFARLTRNVLDSKELISLNEEKTLLDDYLQMEQLRFGFQYKINASTDLDKENIEIPAMLLQPFVENSVKHGIAEKASEGKIEVSFEKNEVDLILKIIDNGKGFDEGKSYSGLGLSLSKNRISLLNTIYKDTPFVLDIQSNSSGTTVTVTLTQWL